MSKPLKITKAFLKHIMVQSEKSVHQLVKAAYDEGRADQRKRDIKICEDMAWRKCEAAAKAELAGRKGVCSHRESDAETCGEIEKLIRAQHVRYEATK